MYKNMSQFQTNNQQNSYNSTHQSFHQRDNHFYRDMNANYPVYTPNNHANYFNSNSDSNLILPSNESDEEFTNYDSIL